MKCLDTYALIEIAKANPKFRKYTQKDFVIADVILAEFYWVLCRDFSVDIADSWFDRLTPYVVSTGSLLYQQSIKLRHERKKQKLTFFDCVGYTLARQRKIPFVTGDKEFEHLPGVEFIKK